MKFLIFIIGCFFTGILYAQDSTPSSDGPYVFYDNNKIMSIGVDSGVVHTQTIDPKGNRVIDIKFASHPQWNFSVALRKKLRDEPAIFGQPKKIFFLSDIEGEFEAFRNLLISNKIVDSTYQWIFGNGHLVICGDLFDRGKEVVQELWLLYKLEDEAEANGGYVHTILGNHDIMNLSGDTRYVQPFYFSDASLMGRNYLDFYSARSELGRWLRTKNIIEKIGDNLCMHAGISPVINEAAISVGRINEVCRPYYDKAGNEKALLSAGIYPFFSDEGLFWYRGYFIEPRATMNTIDSSLYIYGCTKIIIGHTILTNNPAMYYKGKVIGIDVNEHEGKHEGVLYENKAWWIVDGEGNRKPLVYDAANEEINNGN